MNLIQTLEQEQVKKLSSGNSIPEFSSGDTVRVLVKVVEGTRERKQAFEGICIARKNAGINSSFTIRKISYGEGVERLFPLYSPNITIEVVRRGIVRRAKLYYLRNLRGKAARITEKNEFIIKARKEMEKTRAAERKASEDKKSAEQKTSENKEVVADSKEDKKSD